MQQVSHLSNFSPLYYLIRPARLMILETPCFRRKPAGTPLMEASSSTSFSSPAHIEGAWDALAEEPWPNAPEEASCILF